MNVFNPGAGSVIADTLLSLQQRREHADLRYDIRLFTSDPDAPVLGESLESMVRPGATVNEAADAFATSTGSHLFSKLNLAKHAISEFHANAKDFPAHISVLLDAFPAEELSIAEKPMGITPLHGLIQDFDTEFIDDDSGTFWNKRPVVGRWRAIGSDFGEPALPVRATCFETDFSIDTASGSIGSGLALP